MVAWNCDCSTGSATLMTVPSMNAIDEPRMVMARAQRPRRTERVGERVGSWPLTVGGLPAVICQLPTANPHPIFNSLRSFAAVLLLGIQRLDRPGRTRLPADGNVTTSFLRPDCHFKDNRILPLGWRHAGPDIGQFFGKPL